MTSELAWREGDALLCPTPLNPIISAEIVRCIACLSCWRRAARAACFTSDGLAPLLEDAEDVRDGIGCCCCWRYREDEDPGFDRVGVDCLLPLRDDVLVGDEMEADDPLNEMEADDPLNMRSKESFSCL